MVATEGRDTLTDADRARLDREWAMYRAVARVDGAAPLIQAWVAGLSPAEYAYVQTKMDAVLAPFREWVVRLADAWAARFEVVTAGLAALSPPAPAVRSRHARAVHRGARR